MKNIKIREFFSTLKIYNLHIDRIKITFSFIPVKSPKPTLELQVTIVPLGCTALSQEHFFPCLLARKHSLTTTNAVPTLSHANS